MGLEIALWRAVAFFRAASLLYAAALITMNFDGYAYPLGGWAVLAVMALWTLYATFAFADPQRRGRPLLAADLAVAFGCVLATAWVETAGNISAGRPTLPVAWAAAAVLSWAVAGGGKRAGVAAALVLSVADILVHVIAGTPGSAGSQTFNGIVLLFLAGLVVGHVVKLAMDAEARLARAVELEAATRERERLARRIHDSVLQVLAMVRRRGDEMGGEAAELARLAGQQEAALRALIGSVPPAAPTAPAGFAPGGSKEGAGYVLDLRMLLNGHGSASVTISTPATPVPIAEHAAREVDAAVAAALDNVHRHCPGGTRTWVLLEDDGAGQITVSVRDDGPGMPRDRLTEAAADGRLGVAQSIRGRIRDLGGTVTIESGPGHGTEIEMTVPSRTPAER